MNGPLSKWWLVGGVGVVVSVLALLIPWPSTQVVHHQSSPLLHTFTEEFVRTRTLSIDNSQVAYQRLWLPRLQPATVTFFYVAEVEEPSLVLDVFHDEAGEPGAHVGTVAVHSQARLGQEPMYAATFSLADFSTFDGGAQWLWAALSHGGPVPLRLARESFAPDYPGGRIRFAPEDKQVLGVLAFTLTRQSNQGWPVRSGGAVLVVVLLGAVYLYERFGVGRSGA